MILKVVKSLLSNPLKDPKQLLGFAQGSIVTGASTPVLGKVRIILKHKFSKKKSWFG